MPASDCVVPNSDETVETDAALSPATSLQHQDSSKNSSSLTESLALPVLERHEETLSSTLDVGGGGQSSLGGQDACLTAGGGSGGRAMSSPVNRDCRVKVENNSSFDDDDDDDREMPKLTLCV